MEGKGGSILVQVEGVFNGCTVGLEGKMGDMNWQTLRDTSGAIVALTSPSTVVIGHVKSGFDIRAALSSAGGTTDVSAVAAT
jgi:hypothetical protein